MNHNDLWIMDYRCFFYSDPWIEGLKRQYSVLTSKCFVTNSSSTLFFLLYMHPKYYYTILAKIQNFLGQIQNLFAHFSFCNNFCKLIWPRKNPCFDYVYVLVFSALSTIPTSAQGQYMQAPLKCTHLLGFVFIHIKLQMFGLHYIKGTF